MTNPSRYGFGTVSIRSASIIFLALVFILIGATLPAWAADDGPALRCVIPPTGGIFIEWHAETGYTYFVQISNTDNPLARWTWAPLIESGAGQSISHEVESTPTKGFFRLKYTDQEIPAGFTVDTADFDQDGISNHDEIDPPYPFTGTDPLDADSDHDGLPDKYERDHGLDPNDDGSVNPNNGPDGDPDRDGLSNLDELNQGTDPSSADSDSDGVSDWDELFVNFTNPLTAIDSDGDGIPDDFEKHLARQLLEYQPAPVYWETYYAGLAQGNLDATHDYTGDGIDAGELYIVLKPIPAAGAPDSEFLVQPESRRNQLYASYRPATATQPESSNGTYYHSQPYDFDAQIKLNNHEDFTSGYLTSRIGGLEWSNGYDSGMVPWYPHMATYYGSARSGYREQPDGWDPLITNFGGDVRQTRFRVIATRVDHEPLNQRYLKIEGKGPYSEHVITEVLSAEPVSIQIPKGRFLTDWYEFSAPMVEGRDTVVNLVPVNVMEVWSDQIAGVEANGFPDKTGQKEYPYILIGATSGSSFNVKIKLESAIQSVAQSKILFRWASEGVVGELLPEDGMSTFSDDRTVQLVSNFNSNLGTERYLVMGYDDNSNGEIDFNETQILLTTSHIQSKATTTIPYKFIPVDQASYNDNKDTLLAWASLTSQLNAFKNGTRFLTAFCNGTVPVPAGSEATTIKRNESGLSHPVGVAFTPTVSPGASFEAIVTKDQTLSEDLIASNAMRFWLAGEFSAAGDEIRKEIVEARTVGNPNLLKGYSIICNDQSLGFSVIDPDLLVCLGRVSLSDVVIRFDVDLFGYVGNVRINGSATDLYDFDFGGEELLGYPARKGAKVQAGYPSLGAGGKVFKTTIDLGGGDPYANPDITPYTFYPN